MTQSHTPPDDGDRAAATTTSLTMVLITLLVLGARLLLAGFLFLSPRQAPPQEAPDVNVTVPAPHVTVPVLPTPQP